jgi:hypothetical protein
VHTIKIVRQLQSMSNVVRLASLSQTHPTVVASAATALETKARRRRASIDITWKGAVYGVLGRHRKEKMVPYENSATTAGDLNKGMAEIIEITAAPTSSQPRIEHLRNNQVWIHKSQNNPWDDEMTDGWG